MFVRVNGRILDYEDYSRKLILVKGYARHALREALSPYGFENGGNSFYSEELDFEVSLSFRTGNLERV